MAGTRPREDADSAHVIGTHPKRSRQLPPALFLKTAFIGRRRHQEWPGHANVATHRPSRLILRDHCGLTRAKSRSNYREDSHRGSIARGSEERGKREPWKATVDLDATD